MKVMTRLVCYTDEHKGAYSISQEFSGNGIMAPLKTLWINTGFPRNHFESIAFGKTEGSTRKGTEG